MKLIHRDNRLLANFTENETRTLVEILEFADGALWLVHHKAFLGKFFTTLEKDCGITLSGDTKC